jgi:hypothetical protein
MPNANTEFWNVVGEQASIDDVKAGDAVRLEVGNARQVVIVTEVWDHPEKGRQVKFRQAVATDIYPEPTLTIVVDNSLSGDRNFNVKREV